jgi:hypothetical protein
MFPARTGTCLVYYPCALIFLEADLHLSKSIEHSLGSLDLFFVITVELEGGLEDLPGLVEFRSLFLELAPLDPYPWLWANSDPALIYSTCPVKFLVSLLHLDVGLPGLVVGLPLHPPFENLASSGDILKQLLEVDVFVPELVNTGEKGYCAVEEVACVLNIA